MAKTKLYRYRCSMCRCLFMPALEEVWLDQKRVCSRECGLSAWANDEQYHSLAVVRGNGDYSLLSRGATTDSLSPLSTASTSMAGGS